MQPFLQRLPVRLLCATALCVRMSSLFANGVASPEAHQGLSTYSRPTQQATTHLEYGQQFDPVAVLDSLKPFTSTLQSCGSSSKGGSTAYHIDSNSCLAAVNANSSDTEWDGCSLLNDPATPSLAITLQVLQCLQPCLAQVFVILYAETQRLLLHQREDVGVAVKLPENACSQLAAAGDCVSTVLDSLTLILRALCLHHAAAFVSTISQACTESGYVLADFCAEVPSVPPVTTPSNCPTEANISTCSQEQSGGPRCPDSACDMLCALWGASNLSVTGYRAYSSSSSNSARKVSAGKTTVISISTLGAVLVLLVVFMAWKMRRYLLCSCCLEETNKMPDVEANDLLTMAQAVQSSQGNAPGAQETPQHAVRKAFDRFPAYVAAKLAGSKKAKQHKYSSRRRAGSPKRLAVSPRGSASTRGIQMTSRSTQDRHAAQQKGHNRWADSSLDNSMRRSDDSTEALIGVETDNFDGVLMHSNSQDSGHYHPDSRASSVSLTLSEQYSIASCSYPPLSLAEIADVADNLMLKTAEDLEGIAVDEQAGTLV